MENDKLKPCPLCGNASNFAVLDDKHEPLYRRLVCNNCHASIADVKGNDPAKRWNTRPIEDGLRAEIEKLKAVLMDIWHITKEELDEENAILETRGDYMQHLERNINRIETITRKELDKDCGQ